jgi:tyrosyl-tRNA synthetase
VTTEDDPRVELISKNVDEVLVADELRSLLDAGGPLQHYIGFEISGQIHLGTGLMCMSKVRDLQAAGVTCRVFLADWHTWINEKLGGDLAVIRRIAVGYFAEGMRSCLAALGGDPHALQVVLASEVYEQDPSYWFTVLEVSKHTTLARMQRSISIMGRSLGESVDCAKLFYPAMQAADIFAQGVQIAQAGTDQRKAHVIARDVATQLTTNRVHDGAGKVIKPVAIHHHLLPSLKKPPVWPVPVENQRDVWVALKMSKSEPGSAIFIHDSPDDIRAKVKKAFCPPEEVEFNPVLEWARHLVFAVSGGPLSVDRPAEHGGPLEFASFEELSSTFGSGGLHPVDLKNAVADHLVELLAPVREHFKDRALVEQVEFLQRQASK